LASQIIVEKIKNLDIYKTSKNIMLFYPMTHEIDLRELTNDCSKNFYYPRVSGENLLVCPNNNEYIKSKFGVLEPTSNPVNPEILDLIFVPALAVDKNFYRLGYGGGYYDRFLQNYHLITTVTPIFKELTTEKLPTEDFDKPINYIVTD
jgi:5-formyltetrahydrofolate cyclo-ligase